MTFDSGAKDDHLTIDAIAAHAGITPAAVQAASTYSILGAPSGDIDSGWNLNEIAPSTTEYTHIDGPAFLYDNWTDGSILAERWIIPKSLFGPGYELVEGVVDNDLFVGEPGGVLPGIPDAGVTYTVKAIPEPASLALVGVGGLGLAGYRRRKA